MLPFAYKIPTFKDGDYSHVEARAIRTAAPGILITTAVEIPGAYRLTHEVSGMAITRGKWAASSDVFGLLELAATLGEIGDWKQDAAEVQAFGAMVVRAFKAAPIEWRRLNYNPDLEAASAARRSASN